MLPCFGRVAQHILEKSAGADDSGRKIIHFEEAVVDQADALVGVDDAYAMRHAVERRLMQRQHFGELICLSAASPNGV